MMKGERPARLLLPPLGAPAPRRRAGRDARPAARRRGARRRARSARAGRRRRSALFEALRAPPPRAWPAREGVAPFVVASDRTLRDIARAPPAHARRAAARPRHRPAQGRALRGGLPRGGGGQAPRATHRSRAPCGAARPAGGRPRGHRQEVRRVRRAARHLAVRRRRASSSASSAPAAAARRRCCGSSPGSSARTWASSGWRGRDVSALAARPAQLRHRLPVLRALPEPHGGAATSPTASRRAGSTRRRDRRAASTSCSALVGLRAPQATSTRRSSRAASSSAWRWPARWRRRPRCLLLDEPLSALDARVRQSLRHEIRGAAAAARRHHHHGHARPGRGARHGRPHRGDEPRRGRAGRHAGRGLHASPRSPFVARFVGQMNFSRGSADAGPGWARVGRVELPLSARRRSGPAGTAADARHPARGDPGRVRSRAAARNRLATRVRSVQFLGRVHAAASSALHRRARERALECDVAATALGRARRRRRAPSCRWSSPPDALRVFADRGRLTTWRRRRESVAAIPDRLVRQPLGAEDVVRYRARGPRSASSSASSSLYPMAQMIWRSLLDNSGRFVGLANYVRYFGTPAIAVVDHQQPVRLR